MSEVTRYRLRTADGVAEDQYGDLVLYQSYAALQQRLAAAEQECAAIKQAISEEFAKKTYTDADREHEDLLDNLGVFLDHHQELEAHLQAREATVAELKELFRRSCQDNLDYLTCQPGCDSYGHEDTCAVAWPKLEFDRLNTLVTSQRATITRLEGALNELKIAAEDVCMAGGLTEAKQNVKVLNTILIKQSQHALREDK